MLSHFTKVGSSFDVATLRSYISLQPELWGEITARQTTPGSPHGDTETIFLRWAKTQTIHAAFNEIPAVDYPTLAKLPVANQLIEDIAALVCGSEIGRVIVTKLKPGGKIEPHIDEGAYSDHYERFHLCLDASVGSNFGVRDKDETGDYQQVVNMFPGELWWFNHKKEHWVLNNSDTPRIHLIADIVAPLYRVERG